MFHEKICGATCESGCTSQLILHQHSTSGSNFLLPGTLDVDPVPLHNLPLPLNSAAPTCLDCAKPQLCLEWQGSTRAAGAEGEHETDPHGAWGHPHGRRRGDGPPHKLLQLQQLRRRMLMHLYYTEQGGNARIHPHRCRVGSVGHCRRIHCPQG